jgi:hypothetical protein
MRTFERFGLVDTDGARPIDTQRRAFVGALAAWGGFVTSGCGGGNGTAAAAQAAPSASAEPAPPTSSTGAQSTTPGTVVIQSVRLDRLVEFTAYHEQSRYERFRKLLVLSGGRASIPFQAYNLASGGSPNQFSSGRYTLLIDGVPAAETTVAANTTKAAFSVDLSKIEAGWHRLDIDGLSGGETCPTYWAFLKRGPVGEQSFTPVVRGTYEMMMSGTATNIWTLAPGKYNPTPRPITVKRQYASPDPKLPRSDLHCEHLVPVRFGDIHRPNRNVDGIMSSFDAQTYFWSTLHAAKPTVALLDGPRGVGTVCMVTHLMIGNAAPDGQPRNNTYFSDAWRIGKVSEDGKITTLVGYRHKDILSHWEDPANVELIGDWSAIPEARRGFHEIWGFAWDDRTLLIDEAAARIASEGNEKPHIVGPVMFVADSQNNRICKLQFSAVVHGPPKVTEFITGLSDPWDIVYADGRIYVSERKAHRIVEYNATTGAFNRVVVQGRPLASVDINREVIVTGTLADRQAAACVAPEGLAYQDGWLYFASTAQDQVRRVNVDTGTLEVVRPVTLDDNSKFAKVAVSDGTFGPRGSTFTWTWSLACFGYPAMYLPDGTRLANWGSASGGTGTWFDHLGYASAGAVGKGRMITAGMVEGLVRVTKSQSGDKAQSAAATRGRTEFYAKGLHLLHGHNGFGFYGLPLPWGASPDIDAYLESFGHTRS